MTLIVLMIVNLKIIHLICLVYNFANLMPLLLVTEFVQVMILPGFISVSVVDLFSHYETVYKYKKISNRQVFESFLADFFSKIGERKSSYAVLQKNKVN